LLLAICPKTFEVYQTLKILVKFSIPQRTTFLFGIPKHFEVETFYPFACPGGFAEKLQAGGNARIVGEAADGNAFAEVFPTVKRD
jgi:hypothetical protein